MQAVKIEGFHGTALENVTNIIENGFLSQKRDDHWLGQGYYFYSDYNLALWWIKRKNKATGGGNPAVIQAVFECWENQWLDLDTVPGVDYFLSEVRSILLEQSRFISLKFKNTDFDTTIRNLCFALDLLKRTRGIKLVALTFRKDKPTYAGESIGDFERRFFPLPFDIIYQERQICATSNDIITSKKSVFPN